MRTGRPAAMRSPGRGRSRASIPAARIDGVPAGSYFDKTFLFSNTVGGGLEYRWPHLGAFAGIDYQ